MICRECGASYVPFKSIRLIVRRLAQLADRRGKARGKLKERRKLVSPSLTELVMLIERDPGPTNFIFG